MGETIFWGNSVARWTIAVSVSIGLIVVLRVVVSAAARKLKQAAARTATDVDDLIVDLVDRTKLASIVVVAASAGSYALVLSSRVAEGIRAPADLVDQQVEPDRGGVPESYGPRPAQVREERVLSSRLSHEGDARRTPD